MALLDFLKRKKENEKALTPKAAKKPAAVKAEVLPGKKDEAKKIQIQDASPSPKTKGAKFSYSVVKEPHISEKATYLGDENKYAFKVYGNTNKLEIKKSVEGIYGVNVVSVNVITIPHKKRRMGKTEGFKKGYKKALVTIKEGQKIEIF